MSDDPDEPVTISGEEMARRLGMTPQEFEREIQRVRRSPVVMVVPGDLPSWRAVCDDCGEVGAGDRETSTTLAHQHNLGAHDAKGQVRVLGA